MTIVRRAPLRAAFGTVATAVAMTLALHAPLADAARHKAAKSQPAAAQPAQEGTTGTVPAWSAVPSPTVLARAWLLLDVSSGQVLASHDADQRVEPASLTKLMTAYLVFSSLRDGQLKMNQTVNVSQVAWKAPGSRMFIEPNRPVTVEELLNGMIVQSGNDATIALAEAVAGTEAAFATRMNQAAKRLGMTNSSFSNASGLPDANHYTTANDLAKLATRLIDEFPQYYAIYSKQDYTYNNIRQPNRNRLLGIDPSVDGFKTGHTDAAGWCLVASARRDQQPGGFQRRLLSVVLGAPSESARIFESQKLLNWGFQNFDAARLFVANKPAATYEIWKGDKPQLAAGFGSDVTIAVPKGQAAQLKTEIERVQPLMAPVAKGQKIGQLRVKLGDRVLAERPLVALDAVEPGGFFSRSWDSLRLMTK